MKNISENKNSIEYIQYVKANQQNNRIKNHPIKDKDYWGVLDDGFEELKKLKNGEKLSD